MFQDNAQAIVDSVKRKIPATKDLVETVSVKVSLPVYQSPKPAVQELSLGGKIKFSYSSDVRNPLTTVCFDMKPEEGEEKSRQVRVDLEKQQLVSLFEEIEKIKEHLDKIYGN